MPAFGDDLKRSINLVEYAIANGYQRDKNKSCRSSTVLTANDDKIVVSRKADDHWVYFSYRNPAGDSGTIIDFVRYREGGTVRAVCEKLRSWAALDSSCRGSSISPLSPRIVPFNRDALLRDFSRHIGPLRDSSYLRERGLNQSLISHPRFAGAILQDVRGNIVFPHHDRDGVTGWEAKGRGWTSFATGGRKGLWLSNEKTDDRVLVAGESAIDALSYAQLHRVAGARYASFGGSASPLQLDLFAAAVDRLPPGGRVLLAFDNDRGGERLAKAVEDAVKRTTERVFPSRKDWNDELRAARGLSR